jgi:hypothetical protein
LLLCNQQANGAPHRVRQQCDGAAAGALLGRCNGRVYAVQVPDGQTDGRTHSSQISTTAVAGVGQPPKRTFCPSVRPSVSPSVSQSVYLPALNIRPQSHRSRSKYLPKWTDRHRPFLPPVPLGLGSGSEPLPKKITSRQSAGTVTVFVFGVILSAKVTSRQSAVG